MKVIKSDWKLFHKEVIGGLMVKRILSRVAADGEGPVLASQALGTR